MKRSVAAAAVLLLLPLSACLSDEVDLRRGPLGPAVYDVRLDVAGGPAPGAEPLTARLSVSDRRGGATLRLAVGGGIEVTAEMTRLRGGRLRLESVQGVSPGSAGEADLASLVGQLDPPLAEAPVSLGDRWSQTRRIDTGTLEARLRSELQAVGFSRVGGGDAVEIVGRVTGRLEADGPSGRFSGFVRGTTRLAWMVHPGRLASSDTRLVWTIPGTGDVVLETTVRPA